MHMRVSRLLDGVLAARDTQKGTHKVHTDTALQPFPQGRHEMPSSLAEEDKSPGLHLGVKVAGAELKGVSTLLALLLPQNTIVNCVSPTSSR